MPVFDIITDLFLCGRGLACITCVDFYSSKQIKTFLKMLKPKKSLFRFLIFPLTSYRRLFTNSPWLAPSQRISQLPYQYFPVLG